MKNQIEPSIASRSQSEASSSNAASKLIFGTTSKIDSIFPVLDLICQNSQIHLFIYNIGAIYLYLQVFISSFYPFNKYWTIVNNYGNHYITQILNYIEDIGYFFHVHNENEQNNEGTNLNISAIIILITFVISTFFILLEIFCSSKHRKMQRVLFYIIRFIVNIISPMVLIPISGIVGNSIRNLVLTGDKLHWFYLFLGIIFYFCFLVYSYIGYIFLTSSTCVSVTLFSTFDIKIPLFLPIISSFYVLIQSIFSLFSGWAMIIVQISHIFVCLYFFNRIRYLVFHTKIANIAFIGVILSTMINDLIFTILYFVEEPANIDHSKVYFFHFAGFLLPFLSLIISVILSSIFVIFLLKKKLKQLKELSDLTLNEEMIRNNDLFRTENSSLMAIHISFIHALPLFYNFASLNYFSIQFPSQKVYISIIQYLSFFPGESRQLNIYLKAVSQNRNMNYHQRFLMFQVYRIKMVRQSSVSKDANRQLAEIKNISNQCYEDMASFWGTANVDNLFLENMSNDIYRIGKKWDQGILDFPNNQKFSDEYCNFLIECQMSLEKALVMKYRADMIEMGKNFIVDVPFIRLVTCFPIYLKNKVIDVHGTVNHDTKNRLNLNGSSSTLHTSGSSANNSSKISLSSSLSESMLSALNLDQEIEDNLGRQLFKQSNLRLELHRAIDKRKSYASNLILYTSIIIFILGFVAFISLYKYCYYYIDYRYDACYYLNLASKTYSYLDLAILGSTLKFAYFTKRFTRIDLIDSLDSKDDEDEIQTNLLFEYEPFRIDDDISFSVIHSSNYISMEYFYEFLDSLNDLANVYGENIYEFCTLLMFNESPFRSCFDGFPVNEVNMSMKAFESYLFLVVEQSASIEVEEGNWYSSNEICEILANQPLFHQDVLKLYSSLMYHELDQCIIEAKIFNILKIIIPIFMFIIDFIPILVFIKLFIYDTNKMVKLLTEIDPQIKEKAKKPIRKDSQLDLSQINEKKLKKSIWKLFEVFLFILSLIIALLTLIMIYKTDDLNGKLRNMVQWNFLSAIRVSSAIESLNYVLNAIILNGTKELNISSLNSIATRKKMIELAREEIEQLENANEYLLKGTNESEPCYEFDEKLDDLNFKVICDVQNNTDMHDSYRCCSTSTGVGILITMMKAALNEIEESGDQLNHDTITHAIHLFNRHLFARLDATLDCLNLINIENCEGMEMEVLIVALIGLIFNVILFLLMIFIYLKSVSIYHVGIILIQRLPPNTFISNKKLLNFMLNRKNVNKESEMSTMQSVIYMSHDAIVCTNVSGVVEIINPAVTNTFGYTPDQMLGQHISSIFSDQKDKINDENNEAQNETEKLESSRESGDAEKITTQLELMSNGQSALVFEDHFVCMTDDAKEMPCGVTIFGMTSGQKASSENDPLNNGNKGAKVESFVVILRDETQLMQQQKEAEAAKAQSENLLYQILPRDIVVRINSGEKDISFTVQSASIIFTDVVRFSEYASTLTPPEIMGSLSTMFAAFDTSAKKYKLLTKIKLIGDIYMAAAGLFADEKTPPSAHAEEILRFGLDCLTELEDVNLKLNANLQLRVGINSGGPLLAGVLGTDKPVFDIIGDPINVAARLQTTDIPGKIQIPKSTYDLVSEEDFTIEERGEVFLKGKGKTMAYLVSNAPRINANIFTASSQKLV